MPAGDEHEGQGASSGASGGSGGDPAADDGHGADPTADVASRSHSATGAKPGHAEAGAESGHAEAGAKPGAHGEPSAAGPDASRAWKDALDQAAPWYSVLVGAIPVIWLYTANQDKVPFQDVAMPLLISTAAAGLLTWALRRRVEPHRAALLATVALAAFYTFGLAVEGLQDAGVMPQGTAMGPMVLLSLVFAGAVAAAVWGVHRLHQDIADLSRIAAVVVLALLIMNGGSAIAGASGSVAQSDALRMDLELAPTAMPDIYYIVPDGYAGRPILSEVYGLNNTAFYQALAGLGVRSTDSRSNYPMSTLSMASALNMVYLDALAEERKGSTDWVAALQSTEDSNVMRALDGAGYETVHVSSGWGATRENPFADRNLDCGGPSEYGARFVHQSLLRVFEDPLVGRPMRDRIECQLDSLVDIAADPQPTFAFAHLLAPHPPYVFDADGRPNRAGEIELAGDPWKDKDGYTAQLEYLNQRLLETIAAIVAVDPDAVIVMHGDHGPASRFLAIGPATLPRMPAEPSAAFMAAVDERFGVMMAIRLPGAQAPEALAPVNAFRLVFDEVFGTELGQLPQKSHYAAYSAPYRFVPV